MSSDQILLTKALALMIYVFDKAAVYSGAMLPADLETVQDNNWIHFNVGGNRVVSNNPNGQDRRYYNRESILQHRVQYGSVVINNITC